LNKFEIALFSVSLGSFLGFAGAYFNNRMAFQRQRKYEASASFREAFVEEYVSCLSSDGFSIKQRCLESFVKHQKAVVLFEPYLKSQKLTQFRRAWDKYCEDMSFKNLNQFVPESGIGKEGYIRELNEKEQRELVLSFYNKLFSFASVGENA
jgi:hypothetical protein